MSHDLGINSYDFVEFYVGSAKMNAYWHIHAMGFHLTGYKGPETGAKDMCSYVLTKGSLKIVLTSAIKPERFDINDFVNRHGDGVKRWAVAVDDVQHAFNRATQEVAVPLQAPKRLEDEFGHVDEASIKLYDDLELVFVNNQNYRGIFKPGYAEPPHWKEPPVEDSGLLAIDHIVGNVRENEMNYWADYLNRALDFETFLYFGPGDISTRYSSLLSKVVHTKDDVIKNPINEPHDGERTSQIEEFINEFHGTGVQHIALKTDDIIHTIANLKKRGVEFIQIPAKYYDQLEEKNRQHPEAEQITQDIQKLRQYEILCDLEGEGYLLQTFTKPIGDRPTFFYEIIQRCQGASGFGQGNFKALFESIERDQERRGSLTQRDEGSLGASS
jgi:4-hydroxyphenylpyruvate dioxygenase